MDRACESTIDLIRAGIGEDFALVERGDFAPHSNACKIRTPFFYPDNDPIVIYAEQMGGGRIRLSDHGEANDFAFLSGVGSRSIVARMQSLQSRLGVRVEGTAMELEVSVDQIGEAVSRFITAVHDLSTLSYTSPTRQQKRNFNRKVEEYLISIRRPYIPKFPITGAARKNIIDYRIEGDRNQPLFLWTFDPKPSTSSKRASEIAFSFIDITKGESSLHHKFAVLVNKQDDWGTFDEYSEGIRVLKSYVPNTIDWIDREQIQSLLTAA